MGFSCLEDPAAEAKDVQACAPVSSLVTGMPGITGIPESGITQGCSGSAEVCLNRWTALAVVSGVAKTTVLRYLGEQLQVWTSCDRGS